MYHFILSALGARQVYCCSGLTDADQYLSQEGFTLVLGEADDIKGRVDHAGIQIESFDYIKQTLILGCFPDQL